MQLLSLVLMVIALSSSVTWAEVRTITATGEYRMGDNDTRTDAKRLALLDAKRLALEQAGVYIQSITEVKNFDLTREEIRAYTAGIVEVLEQTTRTTMDGDTTVVRVDVTAKIDTDAVAHEIAALRTNETVKKELMQSQAETDRYYQQLEAFARSEAETKAAGEPLQQRLAKTEAAVLVTRAWRELGRNYITGARRLAEQAFGLDPSSREVRVLNAMILYKERRYDALIHEFSTALRLQPDDTEAHLGRGREFAAKGNLDGAITAFREAVRLNRDNAVAYFSLGRVLEATGDHRGALAAYREVVRLDPDNAAAHYHLAGLLAIGDWPGALAAYRKAVRLDPDNAAAHAELWELLAYTGDWPGALAASRALLRLRPNNADAHVLFGRALEETGDRPGAIVAFRKALSLKPDDARAHFVLGKALQKMGRAKEAAKEFREVLRFAPDVDSDDLVNGAREALRELEK